MSKPSAFGPGALITAAFIGPGTVTVCTLAGISDGYSLLWAILLAVVICYLLQEMAARLGLVTRRGLGDVLRSQITSSALRIVMLAIVFGAIVIGNAAYEAGNISGGALGLEALTGTSGGFVNVVIAILAAVLLYTGSYRLLERALIAMVLLMSIAFVLVAIATQPKIADLFSGLVPEISAGQTLTVIGLIGTTVVPYNLFLHASIVQEKWSGADALPAMRRDTAITIAVGGLISMAIIVSAAAIQGSEVSNAAQLARSLEPVFGAFSRYILAIGLFAAGVTSAITAPLAAAYAASGCFGWSRELRSLRMRMVWLTVLLAGLLFSLLGGSPIEIIRFAQITNGILLPLIVGFVLWAVNRRQLVGAFANTRLRNLLGGTALLVVSVLSLRSVWLVLQSLL